MAIISSSTYIKLAVLVLTLVTIIYNFNKLITSGKFSELPLVQTTFDMLARSSVVHTITIDVYGLAIKPGSEPQFRMAVVRPFNWIFVNSNFNVYKCAAGTGLLGIDKFCRETGVSPFLRFNKFDSGLGVDKMKLVCLPFTPESIIQYFSNSVNVSRATVELDTSTLTRFSDISAVNLLIHKRYFIIDANTLGP